MKVVLASKNPHKLVEIRQITDKFGFDLVLQSELGIDIDGRWGPKSREAAYKMWGTTDPVEANQKYQKQKEYYQTLYQAVHNRVSSARNATYASMDERIAAEKEAHYEAVYAIDSALVNKQITPKQTTALRALAHGWDVEKFS